MPSNPRTASDPPDVRRLIVLGSTGSIGVGVLDVVTHLAAADEEVPTFEVVGLAAGRRGDVLEAQATKFKVDDLALAEAGAASSIDATRSLRTGPDAALELVRDIARPGDLVVAAMVGAAGIPSILAAIDRG